MKSRAASQKLAGRKPALLGAEATSADGLTSAIFSCAAGFSQEFNLDGNEPSNGVAREQVPAVQDRSNSQADERRPEMKRKPRQGRRRLGMADFLPVDTRPYA